MKQVICVLLCCVFTFSGLNAQEKEPKTDSLVWQKTIIPVVFFLPETSLAGGATGILSFKNSSAPEEERPSQILFAGIYTLKNQVEFITTFEIYKNKRKHRFRGEIGYYRFFYNYFGIGADSREEDHEIYEVNFPRVEFSYARKLYKIFNVGLGYKMDYFDIHTIEEGGLLQRDDPIGIDGGFKSNLLGLFFVDTRDNINAPYKGLYMEVTHQQSLGFFFSDFDYTKTDVDLRYYTQLKDKWTLGHQLWVTHNSEGSPFYEFPHISTASRSRGFDDRRFINPRMATLQSELRFPLLWRFRGSVFYTYNVLPDSWSDPFAQREYFSYGAGLRYILNEENRTSIRLDIANGDGKFNFYLTANEAF
jgi:outer membrane protein assembly factor BamA